jgi:hypothetical protein
MGASDDVDGMLGLTDKEEDQIVAFLETLTDGFTAPYPNSDTFTGSCMTCNPATDPNLFAVAARERRIYPDTASTALGVGHMRC